MVNEDAILYGILKMPVRLLGMKKLSTQDVRGSIWYGTDKEKQRRAKPAERQGKEPLGQGLSE